MMISVFEVIYEKCWNFTDERYVCIVNQHAVLSSIRNSQAKPRKFEFLMNYFAS